MVAAGGAAAQTSPPDKNISADMTQSAARNTPAPGWLKPNEIQRYGHVYSGALVQVVKTDNPLQLINPFAPAEYGSGEDNLSRDWSNRKATGLRILSLKF
jgi:hypothetical protein